MELLPCPFCGGTSVTVEEGTTYRWAVATCVDCGATASEVRAVPDVVKTQELALAEWNRRASPASVPEGFTMSEPAILPDGSGFGTMTEREATLLGKVERQSAALKLAREALQGIHPGNMTPMAEKNWMEAIAAIDSLQKGE